MSESEDPARRQIAQFVATALKVPGEPEELISAIDLVREDASSAIYILQLQTPELDDAAFLIYSYRIEEEAEGSSNTEGQFENDLRLLLEATENQLPGPRLLAHATTADYAFILATSPETYRALTGEASEQLQIIDPEQADQIRRDAAAGMLLALRDANRHATDWLNAAGAAAGLAGEETAHAIPMLPEETALALHISDGRNVQDMLHALNFFIEWTANQGPDSKGSIAT